MKNRKLNLRYMGLFHTPTHPAELTEFIGRLPADQQASTWTAVGLLNNMIVDSLLDGNLRCEGMPVTSPVNAELTLADRGYE